MTAEEAMAVERAAARAGVMAAATAAVMAGEAREVG